MSSKIIHIAHLTMHGLNWASLNRKAGQCHIEALGSLAGDASEVLDRWLDDIGDRTGASIRLYDSRPLVFSFMMNLPAKARRQVSDAIRLRIRSELGLGPDSVYWTERIRPSEQDDQLLDVNVMVVRCDAMTTLIDWRDRHGLDSLWIAPDYAALDSLCERGLVESPAKVVCREPGEMAEDSPVTVYRLEASGAIFRNRVADIESLTRDPGQSSPVYFSGQTDVNKAEGDFSVIETLGEGLLPFAGESRLEALCQFDPIVLGGALENSGVESPGRGLLEAHEPMASPLMQRVDHLKMKSLVVASVLIVALAAGSVWSVMKLHEKARQRVVVAASKAMPEISALSSEEAVLRQVKADRSSLIPVIEAIHKAAPNGIMLESLSIGDSGLIRINGTAQNPDVPNQFFKALGEEKRLEKVHMPQVGSQPQGKGFRFQLMAQMKGRK